jgi:hypothetical protein
MNASTTGAVAAAIVAQRRRRILARFREAAALSPDRARGREELGIRDSHLFRRLVSAGVLVSVDGGRYYLDEEAARRERRRRVTRALIVIGLVVMILLVALVLARGARIPGFAPPTNH